MAQRVLSMADAVYAKTWASDLSKLDVKGCIRENNKPYAGDENFILEHSTRQLVQALAKPLDVSTGEEVVLVKQVKAGHVEVRTKKGTVYSARRVLVCAPITTVKNREIAFEPLLPSWYDKALNEAGIGVSIKGLMRFSERFWPKDVLLVFCSDSVCAQLWMDPDRPSYRNEAFSITCFVTGQQVCKKDLIVFLVHFFSFFLVFSGGCFACDARVACCAAVVGAARCDVWHERKATPGVRFVSGPQHLSLGSGSIHVSDFRISGNSLWSGERRVLCRRALRSQGKRNCHNQRRARIGPLCCQEDKSINQNCLQIVNT